MTLSVFLKRFIYFVVIGVMPVRMSVLECGVPWNWGLHLFVSRTWVPGI